MTVEELVEKDSSFNSSVFISRVNNMIKKLYNATSLNELDTVDHFVSDKVLNIFKKEIIKANSKHKELVYEQVNVNSEIKDIYMDNEYYYIKCICNIAYYKKYLGKINLFNNISSDKKTTEVKNILLKKPINGHLELINRCLGCGNSVDINDTGICPNCGRIFDLEKFDYYIEEFE